MLRLKLASLLLAMSGHLLYLAGLVRSLAVRLGKLYPALLLAALLAGCASTLESDSWLLDPLAAPSVVKVLCAEPAETLPKWEDGGCV